MMMKNGLSALSNATNRPTVMHAVVIITSYRFIGRPHEVPSFN